MDEPRNERQDQQQGESDAPELSELSSAPAPESLSPELVVIENQSSPYCPINQVVVTGEGRTNPLYRFLFGQPLRSEDVPDMPLAKRIGLAIFSSDALSSVAYATQELLQVLVLAGAAALSLSIPIAGAICVLLILVTLSYRQIIFGYPHGGGSYTVARDNLGEHTAQVSGASLLADYVMTVAVSMSAGVSQLTSAFPVLGEYRIVLCIALILIMTLINLRGVRETKALFAVPTYLFLAMMGVMIAVGFWQLATGTLPVVTVDGVAARQVEQVVEPLTIFLILRAFAAGSVAITGMEAISIRSLTFHRPRKRNAATTILVIAGLVMFTFFSVTLLAHYAQVMPMEQETVISQLARTIFANDVLYYVIIVATTLILIAATNTSFARFPRLAAIQAGDGFLPRWLALKGHRLAFSWGIVVLSIAATLVVVLFDASVSRMIPLYAIAVFLSMTMAQASMVVYWRKVSRIPPGGEIRTHHAAMFHDPHWRIKMALNIIGGLLTATIVVVFTVSSFMQGAWMLIAGITVMVWIFFQVRRHYRNVAQSLSLEAYQPEPEIDASRHTVVILVGGVHRGTLVAGRYARSIQAARHIAVHVESDPARTERVQERWKKWMPDLPLVVVESPYRTLIRPLVRYVNNLTSDDKTDLVTIVIPQFVCARWWHHLLHNQTVLLIRSAFLFDRDKVVIEVPFRLEE